MRNVLRNVCSTGLEESQISRWTLEFLKYDRIEEVSYGCHLFKFLMHKHSNSWLLDTNRSYVNNEKTILMMFMKMMMMMTATTTLANSFQYAKFMEKKQTNKQTGLLVLNMFDERVWTWTFMLERSSNQNSMYNTIHCVYTSCRNKIRCEYSWAFARMCSQNRTPELKRLSIQKLQWIW